MAVQIRSKIGAQRRAFELNRPDDPAVYDSPSEYIARHWRAQ